MWTYACVNMLAGGGANEMRVRAGVIKSELNNIYYILSLVCVCVWCFMCFEVDALVRDAA